MINFSPTSNILIVVSLLTFAVLFFVGLAIPDRNEIIGFGYDTSFLVLIIGYTLRQKSFQQLIGLFLYIGVYNLDIFKVDLFQIQNHDVLYFARKNGVYAIIVSFAFLFPTLFDKYKLVPLTNRTNINDFIIIWSCIVMTILIQTSIRLMV